MYIWGLTTEENLSKIEILQKKCVRIMTFSDFHCHTNLIFLELKLLKVCEIIKSQQLKLSLVKDIHTYETKSATRHLLHIPQMHTTSYGNKSLKYHCSTLWNSTMKNNIAVDKNVNNNIHIDSIHNLYHFKRILKKHYLHSYSLC